MLEGRFMVPNQGIGILGEGTPPYHPDSDFRDDIGKLNFSFFINYHIFDMRARKINVHGVT